MSASLLGQAEPESDFTDATVTSPDTTLLWGFRHEIAAAHAIACAVARHHCSDNVTFLIA